jgi:glycosyltransferase involved in cell wall biosynthesis
LPIDKAKDGQFDCILFQDDHQYLEDQYLYLSEAQRKLPRIYLEHDTPREHPTDMRHPVEDNDMLLVHVTPFNELMWDNHGLTTRVIEHGVLAPEDAEYSGELERGIVVVNHLARRGRRLGGDVFERVRAQVSLDLAGMGAGELGGTGEVLHAELPRFIAQYRFFFNPIRYTSLGLAVIEAMMTGLPIVGLATAEMATVIDNGTSGYVDTNVSNLVERMRELLRDPALARKRRGARKQALERFSIERFVRDWGEAFRLVTG